MSYPLVTLCGSYNLKFDWVRPCIESWRLLDNVDVSNFFLIPDERLEVADEEFFLNHLALRF